MRGVCFDERRRESFVHPVRRVIVAKRGLDERRRRRGVRFHQFGDFNRNAFGELSARFFVSGRCFVARTVFGDFRRVRGDVCVPLSVQVDGRLRERSSRLLFSLRGFSRLRRNSEQAVIGRASRSVEEILQDGVVDSSGIVVTRRAVGWDVPHTAAHASHTATHAAHHTAAHAAHTAHHAAAHAAHHAAHHHAATAAHAHLVRTHDQVADRVETQAGRDVRVVLDLVLGGDVQAVVQDAEVEFMRTKDELERLAQRDVRKAFLDSERAGGTSGFFNIQVVKDNIDFFLILVFQDALDAVDPVGQGEVGVRTAVHVDFAVERSCDNLFFFAALEISRLILFLTFFGQRDPDFGVRISDRRFVGDRNMSFFDRHERVEELAATFETQELVAFVGVAEECGVGRLGRKRVVGRNLSGFISGFGREDEIVFSNQRVETLHDFDDGRLVGLISVLRTTNGFDRFEVLLSAQLGSSLFFRFLFDVHTGAFEFATHNGAIGFRKDAVVAHGLNHRLDVLFRAFGIDARVFHRVSRSDGNGGAHLSRLNFDVRCSGVDQRSLVFSADLGARGVEEVAGAGVVGNSGRRFNSWRRGWDVDSGRRFNSRRRSWNVDSRSLFFSGFTEEVVFFFICGVGKDVVFIICGDRLFFVGVVAKDVVV